MILCEWDAPEGDPGQSCVHLYARILSSSLTSVSIFSVWCYSSVLYLDDNNFSSQNLNMGIQKTQNFTLISKLLRKMQKIC